MSKYNFTNAVLTYQDDTQVKWNSSYDMNVKFNVKQAGNTATLDISVTGVVMSITRTSSAFVRRATPREIT